LDYYTRDAKGKLRDVSMSKKYLLFFLGYGFVEYEESRDAGK